jgi:succinoglycan biosynthesis protein ExoA
MRLVLKVRMRPFVSVIIPCRNEQRFLGQCLDSILGSDYPAGRMEVIIADGSSNDGTREVIARYLGRDARVRWVDNPEKTTPVALNRALDAARGEIIARIDAHAEMAPDYLSRCVESLERTGADNVGGVRRELAQDQGPFAGPIIAALTHPFGVGNAHYRFDASKPRWVDTVFGGCWRRETFSRIGKFNERLPRTQDLEFNQRLRRAGGKILLVPELVTYYYTRSRPGRFCGHNWTNGVWSVLPFAYSSVIPVRWRHLAPLGFVGVGLLLCLAAALRPEWAWAPALIVAPYLAANLGASLHVAFRERNWRYAFLMPIVFASLHVAYGAGSLWGTVQLGAIGLARILRRKNA